MFARVTPTSFGLVVGLIGNLNSCIASPLAGGSVKSTRIQSQIAIMLSIPKFVESLLVLEEIGLKQPPPPVNCYNVTAAGIANDSVKKQHSRLVKMQLFWIMDQVKLDAFDV